MWTGVIYLRRNEICSEPLIHYILSMLKRSYTMDTFAGMNTKSSTEVHPRGDEKILQCLRLAQYPMDIKGIWLYVHYEFSSLEELKTSLSILAGKQYIKIVQFPYSPALYSLYNSSGTRKGT